MELNSTLPLPLNGECPFSWNLSEDLLKIDFENEYDPENGKEFYPLIMLMYEIMNIYVKTKKEDSNLESIINSFNKCDDNIRYLKAQNHPQISIPTAVHIFEATQAHVFHQFGLNEKLDELQTVFTNIDLEDNKSRSTLEACKSIAVTKKGARESIPFIRKAIQENPDCDLWYHMLGKELRRIRRDENGILNDEERQCFEKSYRLSKQFYYGVFLAQMYREYNHFDVARNMYNEIFESINLDSPTLNNIILLKLALGFIRIKNFKRARLCLDKVFERLPQSCPVYKLYSHYKGIFYLEQKRYREALPHLERAITQKDLAVEKDYLRCRSKIQGRRFNTTEYLQYMLKKYENLHNSQKLCLHVELALSYWKKDNNLNQALRSFLDAFELDSTAEIFTKYRPCINVWIENNSIIQSLKELLTPEFYDRFRSDEEMINMANRLQNYL